MCGICGIFGTAPVNMPTVDQMVSNMIHRGPDDSASLTFDGFSIGHTRLSIQDPENSLQPMVSHSGDSVITFNGEIYNQDELRLKLPDKEWKTSGDTELLIELLECFGIEVLASIEGMFAFGWFSMKKKELVLARDRMGEKPLFFRSENSYVQFASELRSLLTSKRKFSDINIEGLAHYLKYLYFPSTASVYSDIKCLEPGNFIKFTSESFSIGNWTEFGNHKDNSKPRTDLRSLISESVRKSLISDVPIGVMLSGGVDSSIIAFEAAKYSDDLFTYSFVMPGHSDDSKYARLMSQRLKTRHIEIPFDKELLPEIILDTLSKTSQPFGDTSIIPLRILTRKASEDVKVLLSGDGADELFSGYQYYDKYFNVEKKSGDWNYFTEVASIRVRHLIRQLTPTQQREMLRKLSLEYQKTTTFESWSEDIAICNTKTVQDLFGFNKVKFVKKSGDGSQGSLSDVLAWDQATYLPNDILFKSDMGGMLSSVEIRAPFLNPRIVEYANDLKNFPALPSKESLKELYRDVIPVEILTRKKQGFGAPVKNWLSIGLLDELVEEYVYKKTLPVYQILKYKKVLVECKRNPTFLWNLLSLNVWLKANVPN